MTDQDHDQLVREGDAFVGGSWVSAGGAELAVEDPASERVVGHVVEADAQTADNAVAAAAGALRAWSRTPPDARADVIDRIADALGERADAFARLVALELGAPAPLARSLHVDVPVGVTRRTAEALRDFEFERTIANSRVQLQPTGVMAAITPWNLQLHQVIVKVIPAIAAGATVVLKPSELTPLTAFELARLIDDCGLPAGVFNVVAGGPEVGERLTRHDLVGHVSFTGSTAVGRRVGGLASSRLKRLTLELGGKSASVVLDDADEATLAKAVKITVANCFLNSGQTCTALSRLIVPRSMLADVEEIAAAAAAKYEPGARLGPLVSAAQRERVHGFLTPESTGGARDLVPEMALPERGYFVAPHVFTDVDPGCRLAREEVFGPVLAVIAAADEAEAVALANATEYGLGGAVWSGSREHALDVAGEIQAGQIEINGAAFNPAAPFGGFKSSGVGREIGRFGIADVLEPRSIQLPSDGS